jgi:hypothetical protein
MNTAFFLVTLPHKDMKYLFILLIATLSFLSLPFYQDSGNEILQLYKSGKPLEIHKYFAEKITVKIIHQEDLLNRQQAEVYFKNFFEKNPFVSLNNPRISGNAEQLQYITGTLVTKTGQFRISILVKKNQIQQYRIESHD